MLTTLFSSLMISLHYGDINRLATLVGEAKDSFPSRLVKLHAMKKHERLEMHIHAKTSEVCVQLHVPSALPPERDPPVPMGSEVPYAPETVSKRWRRETSLHPPGMEPRSSGPNLV